MERDGDGKGMEESEVWHEDSKRRKREKKKAKRGSEETRGARR